MRGSIAEGVSQTFGFSSGMIYGLFGVGLKCMSDTRELNIRYNSAIEECSIYRNQFIVHKMV